MLFQRKKELDIREYDLKNFQGPHQPVAGPGRDRHSDVCVYKVYIIIFNT